MLYKFQMCSNKFKNILASIEFQELIVQTLETKCLGLKPSSATYQLCYLGKII